MGTPDRRPRAVLGLLLALSFSPAARAETPHQQSRPAPVALQDLSRPERLDQLLRRLDSGTAARTAITVAGGRAVRGAFTIAADQQITGPVLVLDGTADVYGTVLGNLVSYRGDIVVHRGAVISGDVLALRGQVHDAGGEIGGEIRTLSGPLAGAPAVTPASVGARVARNLAGVIGLLLAIGLLGITLVIFGRPNLSTVSETVLHSFGRSFLTGLLGQLLVLPTVAIIALGLVLTVVGVLLLPFAALIIGLLLAVLLFGGALAAAHAAGETYTRRRLAQGAILPTNSFRYIILGIAVPGSLWLVWAVFGWVPLAGTLLELAAVAVTWVLVTAGFGAALLSRAGVRENFAGRIVPPEALTDEYLWATPQFGVPAVKRPGGSRTPGAS